MRVTLQREVGILTLPENNITLDDITEDGYVYSVTYVVDPVRANNQRALRVNISTRMIPRVQTRVSLLNNPENVSVALLQRNSQQKDAARNNGLANNLARISDITTAIPNDMAHTIANGTFSRTERQFVLATPVDLARLNVQPVTLHVDSAPVFIASENQSLQSSAQNLLFTRGLDPATIGTRNRTISTPSSLLDGLMSQQVARVVTNNGNEQQLINTLQLVTSVSNPVIAVQTIATFKTLPVTETITIPFNSETVQQDEFYIVFDLIKADGTSVEVVSVGVSHSKNISAFTTPKHPPTVTSPGSSVLGKTFLYVKQNDAYATGVAVYKRTMSFGLQTNNAQYSLVGRFPLLLRDGETRIEDIGSNYNPVIYRVVSYGEDTTLSSEFGSIVSQAQTTKTVPSFVVVVPTVRENGIQLEIKNIPTGPIVLKLYKKNMTSSGGVRELVGKPLLLQSTFLTIDDSNVSKGQIYRYTVELVYKTGYVAESSSVIVHFNPETNNIIDTRIDSLVVESDDVKFTITTSFIETDETKIKSALERQGLFGLFTDHIDRSRLQALVAHKIVRQNLSTGQEEEFGVVTDPLFSDKQLGPVRNVTPLVEGNGYKYTITSFFRRAETLLTSFVQDVKHPTNPTRDYSFKPNKWRHPITLSEGSLVTEASLKAYHANDLFSFGQVGKITSVSVSLANVNPSIVSAQTTKINNKLLRVQWTVQGTISKIDHFLVVLGILGSRTIVGKAHNMSDSGQFFFLDPLDDGEKGALKYFVTPVYHDFSRGREVETNTVLI